MADIKYSIIVDSSGAIKSIKEFDGALKDSARQGGEVESKFGGLWKQFAIGQLAVDALKKAVRLLSDFVKDSIDSAAAQELAERNLADALTITGRTRDALLPGLRDVANQIQRETIYTDDAALSSLALMTQLSNLDKKGLEAAAKGAIGLASVFKVDLSSASTIIAKAMAGNYEMMGRYIPQVKNLKTEEEKHALIMETLATWYLRAKGETDTFSGSLKQLANMWDEVKEAVGGAITENETVRKTIKDLTESVTKLAESDDFKLYMDYLVEDTVAGVKAIGKFAGALKDLLPWNVALELISKGLTDEQKKLNESLDRAAAAGHDYRGKLKELAEEAAKTKPPINEIGNAMKGTGELTKEAMEQIKKIGTIRATLTDQVQKSTLKEYEYQKWALKAQYDEKKASIIADIDDEKEKGAALLLARKSYNVQLAALEKKHRDTELKARIDFAYKIREIEDEEAINRIAAAKTVFDEIQGVEFALNLMTLKGLEAELGAIEQERIAKIRAIMEDKATTEKQKDDLLAIWEEYYRKKKGLAEADAGSWKTTMAKISGYADTAINGMNAIFGQAQKNKEIALENEYKKRLGWINANVKDEDERQKAVMALEAEYQIKRTSVKREMAKQEKAIALMGAVVNTARAVTEALPNIVLAALAAALGAIQIGVIAAQPIPLAKGAVFMKPTYLVGEGGPEALIPVKEIPRIYNQITNTTMRPQTIYNRIQISISEWQLKPIVVKIVEGESKRGNLKIYSKSLVN